MRKEMEIWSVLHDHPNFREMKDGHDYIFTDANEKEVIVDVLLLTYNHVRYIRHAVESVLMQKTRYRYRLIIADDCSTDGTTDIVREYQKKYPNRIATILWTHNVGAGCNAITLHRHATAKYHATLEGDDYWTDCAKLEKAISFLEDHPEYAAYAHNVRIVDENENLLHVQDDAFISHYVCEEHICPENNIKNLGVPRVGFVSQTSGIVDRNFQASWNESDWDALGKCREYGDVVRGLCLTNTGKVFFSRDIMSAYRKVFHGDSHSARVKGKNWSLELYYRRKDLAEFCQKVYHTELTCFDDMALGYLLSAARILCADFNISNLKIFAHIWVLEMLRRHRR